jgi:hypothetical protein
MSPRQNKFGFLNRSLERSWRVRGGSRPELAKAVIETLEDRRYLSVAASAMAPSGAAFVRWFDHGTLEWTQTANSQSGSSTAAQADQSNDSTSDVVATAAPVSAPAASDTESFTPPFNTNTYTAPVVVVTPAPTTAPSTTDTTSTDTTSTDSTSTDATSTETTTTDTTSTDATPTDTTSAPTVTTAPSVVTVSNVGSVALPSLAYITPASNPTLPAGMNTFTPPGGTASAAAGAPILGAYDQSAAPDQSIALTGSQFTADSGASANSDTQFVVYGQTNANDGDITAASIEDLTANGATVTIDASEPANSMYVVWGVNADGAGAPVAINQTQAWWIGASGETVAQTNFNSGTQSVSMTAGQSMSVYGQNLTSGASGAQSWVYLQSTNGGQSFWANVTAANAYKVDFTVDTPGSYQVWVNNGLGGQYSWSEVTQNGPNGATPVVLTVNAAAASTWSNDPSSIINVKNYGALGNGTGDDAPAILNAIKALKPGDTLYLPAGTYMISGGEELALPSDVRVMGDGMGQTKLQFVGAVNTAVYNYGVQFGIGWWDNGAQNVEMDSLTVEHMGTTGGPVMVLARDGGNILLNQVQIIGNNSQPLCVNGSVNVSVQNSSIQGSRGTDWLWVQDGFINNTTFQLAYGAQAALNAGGSFDTSITDCTVGDANDSITSPTDWSGSGEGRFIEYNTDFGQIYNQYVSGNSTDFSAPVAGNMGEQIAIEGQSQAGRGAPTAVSGDTLTFSGSELTPYGGQKNFSPINPGDVMIVDSGPGMGEMRRISSVSYVYNSNGTIATATVTLETPFNVTPDSTSNIYMGTTEDDAVFYQNSFADLPGADGDAHLQAATALCVFGGSYNLIFDSNSATNLTSGVGITSAGTDNPAMFIQVRNNTMQNVAYGLSFGGATPMDPNTNYVGVDVYNNAINATTAGVNLGETRLMTGSDTLTIIEANAISAPVGVYAFNDPHTLLRDNAFTAMTSAATPAQSPQAIVYENSSAPAVRLSNNTYQGFAGAQTYVNIVPTEPAQQPVLDAPYHVIDVTATSGSSAAVALPIYNDSPTTLAWTATTGASWLALSAASGVISGESNAAAAMLVADTAGLAPGKYETSVTLSYTAGATATSQVYTIDLTVQ